MLKSPFADKPFEPTLSYILAALSIYDREETKGEKLWKYNPNNINDREKIIKLFILKDLMYLSYRHRYVLMSILKDALSTPNFHFSQEVQSDHDAYLTMAWDETKIENPRGFFMEIYRIANEEWKDDLHKASLEDPSTW